MSLLDVTKQTTRKRSDSTDVYVGKKLSAEDSKELAVLVGKPELANSGTALFVTVLADYLKLKNKIA